MSYVSRTDTAFSRPCSPLILSDRLITLAEAAEQAGYTETAERLVTLACTIFDEAPRKPH
jgi:hypothetical protein